MKMFKISIVLTATALVAFTSAGCSSSSSSCDGACPDAGNPDVGTGNDGPVLFGLSDGTYCYDVTAIATGFSDGCGIGVDAVVGMALPATYTASAGTLSVGTDGSLGAGAISHNMGTLTRDNTPTLAGTPACSWHQTDTTTVVLTATNMFTASVVETQSTFATACPAADTPAGGSCTSTWKWTMAINGSKSPTTGCN